MDWGWQRSFKLDREAKVVLGLDIGLSSVKMVRLRKDDDGAGLGKCTQGSTPIGSGLYTIR